MSDTPLSVLVMSDAPAAAECTAELLRPQGWAVHVACSEQDALKLAWAWRPDVVLLDARMPEADAWRVASRLRARAVGPWPAVLTVNGLGGEADGGRPVGVGIDAQLVMPVGWADLTRLLRWLARVLAAGQSPPEGLPNPMNIPDWGSGETRPGAAPAPAPSHRTGAGGGEILPRRPGV